MVQTREAVGFVALLIGAAALTAVNHHPTHGRHTERERLAVEAVTSQFTHEQIADAWTHAKVGNPQPLLAIEHAFPLQAQTVHEAGAGILFTFIGHGETCIDFLSVPDGRSVTARDC
jgi:hypothetical protein